MSLDDVIQLISVLPPEEQLAAINTITSSLGLSASSTAPSLPMDFSEVQEEAIPPYITSAT